MLLMIPRRAQQLALFVVLFLPLGAVTTLHPDARGAPHTARHTTELRPREGARPGVIALPPGSAMCATDRRGVGPEHPGVVLIDGRVHPELGEAPEGLRAYLFLDRAHHAQGYRLWLEDAQRCHVITLPAANTPRQRAHHRVHPATARRGPLLEIELSTGRYLVDLRSHQSGRVVPGGWRPLDVLGAAAPPADIAMLGAGLSVGVTELRRDHVAWMPTIR